MLFRSECFVTQGARNIIFNVDIPVILSECFLGLELLATHITKKIIIVIFCVFNYFDPIQASVCIRLTIKLCLETFTFLMTGATY